MAVITCELIHAATAGDIWGYMEGNLDDEVKNGIQSHILKCRPCLDFFAAATQHVKDMDPKRYDRFHQEVMAVRRAELLRYCRNNDIEIDISKAKEPDDYFRIAIAAMLPGREGSFNAVWDGMSGGERDEMVLELIQIMHDEG